MSDDIRLLHRGDRNIGANGEEFIVDRYLKNGMVMIVWESDNARQIVTYQQAKITGAVEKKPIDPLNTGLVGTSIEDIEGETAVVVECLDDKCLLRYLNGDLLDGVPSKVVEKGTFSRKYPYSLITPTKSGAIETERARTFEHARYMLNAFHRCFVDRPCGFGKTWMAMELFKSPMYSRCLFLYPNDDAKNMPFAKNCEAKDTYIQIETYQWLIRQNKKGKIEDLNFDIVVFDEAHFIGGDENGNGAYETYKAVMSLINSHPHTHFLGLTATSVRMDGIDVCQNVFLGHEVYKYDLIDAIEDGMIKQPAYYIEYTDVAKGIRDDICKEIKLDTIEEFTRANLAANTGFNEKDIRLMDAKYMPENIRKAVDENVGEVPYMQFIIFSLTHADLEERKEEALACFTKAFPEYEIGHVVVTSESEEDLSTIENLSHTPSDSSKKGKIDLIFNCEILCRGYHSEFVRGLIMYRATRSFAKYLQMLGRLLSCDNENTVVVFDIMDNLHADFVYGKTSVSSDVIESEPKQAEYVEPETFREIAEAYPYGINYADINRKGCAARKAAEEVEKTEMIRRGWTDDEIEEWNESIKTKPDFGEDPAPEPTETSVQGSKIATESSSEEKSCEEMAGDLEKAREYMHDKLANGEWTLDQTIAFAQAVNETAKKMEKDEAARNETAKKAPSLSISAGTAVKVKVTEVKNNFGDTIKVIAGEIDKGNTVAEDPHLPSTAKYNYLTGNIEKIVNIKTKRAKDAMKHVRGLLERNTIANYDKAVAQFLEITAPECKEVYTDESQINRGSVKWKFWTTVCKMCGVSPDAAAAYTISTSKAS